MGRHNSVNMPPLPYRANPSSLGVSDRRYLEVAFVAGARIRRLRLDRGWKLSDLSERVRRPESGRPYSRSYLSRMERGWANPPLYLYLRVAEALEVDEWLLFARDDVETEVSAAEMVVVRFLRETGIPPEQALARLADAVSPRRPRRAR